MGEWFAGSPEDYDDDSRVTISVNGHEVIVLRVNGEYKALVNRCLHMGGPVGEGLLIGRVCAVLDEQQRVVREEFSEEEIQIVCPWHGWAYDVSNGTFAGDNSLRLQMYSTEVRPDGVYVID